MSEDRSQKPRPPEQAGRLRPGTIIDHRFTLVRRLGAGSSGVVWAARDQQREADVALKILHPQLSGDAALVSQLAREAQVLERLDHPNITRALAFKGQGPFIYLAMELLEGEDLAQVLDRKGKLPPTLAVQTLLPIAHALASAHAKGIVHRDVKPENIFLAHDEVTTTLPKLLDFGVVRIVNNPRKLTMDGAVVGTPDYMSPEQARGKTTTGQTDLWSLCVVLYETIAGRRPFDGDNYNALMRSIIEDEPPTLADLGASDTDLSFVIQRGLVKDPKERWMTMRELGEELALWLQDQGVTEDVTGASLKRGWLADTESQRIELPPYVRQVLESGIVQPGPQSGSNPRIVAPVSGSQPQISEPDLAAIADMNRGGDPEELLLRATRRRNVAIIIGLIVTVLVATLFVLIGTGIIVTSE